jgi:hypothetical protein
MKLMQPSLTAPIFAFAFAFGMGSAWAQNAPAASWQDSQPCPSWVSREGGAAPAQDKRWDLTLSPYTLHWGAQTPEHKKVVLGSLDRAVAGNRLCGMSLFSNSFGQPTMYVYVGQRWDPLFDDSKWFAKVTAGIFYGYVGKYKDKVPFNYNGFSPGIIPSIGYAFSPTNSAQVLILGNAGLMFAYGHRF